MTFEENSTVTDDNLGELKIQDYDAYFAEQFENELSRGTINVNPALLHPVS